MCSKSLSRSRGPCPWSGGPGRSNPLAAALGPGLPRRRRRNPSCRRGGDATSLVLRLDLEGTIDLATRASLDEAIGDLRARVFDLEIDETALTTEPTEDDLDGIDAARFVRGAIDRLRWTSEGVDAGTAPAGSRSAVRLTSSMRPVSYAVPLHLRPQLSQARITRRYRRAPGAASRSLPETMRKVRARCFSRSAPAFSNATTLAAGPPRQCSRSGPRSARKSGLDFEIDGETYSITP